MSKLSEVKVKDLTANEKMILNGVINKCNKLQDIENYINSSLYSLKETRKELLALDGELAELMEYGVQQQIVICENIKRILDK